MLAEQQRLLREAFAAHRGEEIDTQGDSFFVAFRSASDAVAAAVAIQRALADHVWPEGVEPRVRIGIHSGEAAAAGERYVGFSVHRAARVGGAAHGGQVLLSDSTRSLVEDDLPEEVFLRDLGSHRLKDVDRPERISQVAAEGLVIEFPPLRGAEPVKSPPALRRRSLLAGVLAGVVAAAVAIPVFALGGGSGSSVAVAGVGPNAVGAVDLVTGQVVHSIPLKTRPGSVAAGEGSVWVTNVNDNSVSRIDLKTNAKAQTIPVGNGPAGITVGAGFVWVANSLDGTVSKIDPNANSGSGGEVDRIRVGNAPTGVAFGAGRVWVANSTDRTVSEIKPGSHTALRTIMVATGADAIAVGSGLVWVVSEAGNSVTRIDVRSGTVLSSVNVGNGPSAVAVGADGTGWVADKADDTVHGIDPRSGRVKVIPVGSGPSGVAVTPGNIVWVSNALAGSLSRIDPAQNKVVMTVPTGNRPNGVAMTASLLYVAVGTSGRAHRGGTLTLLQHDSFHDFFAYPHRSFGRFGLIDPAFAFDAGSIQAILLTNDGLVAYRAAGGSEGSRLVPDLALTIPAPSNGGRTYTFQLREGIHYSTGELVRPADFRRAIERELANPGLYTGDTFFTGIVGVAACAKTPKRCDLRQGIVADPASSTVTFHLAAPDPDFPYKLAFPAADAVPADTPLKARSPLPATGPYMIKSFDPKRELRLVRNPRFHEWSEAAQPNGYPDEIVWKFGVSLAAQVRAVEQDQADYAVDYRADALSPARLSALRAGGHGSQLHLDPRLATSYVSLNTRVPPFNNVKARQAFNYAVDRNTIAKLQGGPDLVQPTCQGLAPNLAGYRRYCPYTIDPSPDGTYTGPDLAKARKLVAASGTKGQTVTFWSGKKFVSRGGAYLVSVLQSLGYKARLKVLTAKKGECDICPVLMAMADKRQTVQAGPNGWSWDYPSAGNFFPLLLTCGLGPPSWFCDRRIDAEITRAQALQISDPQAAAELWSTIDRETTLRGPLVYLQNSKQLNFVSRRVGNYQHNPQWGVLLDQLWVR